MGTIDNRESQTVVEEVISNCRTFEYQKLKIDSGGSESNVPIAPKESKKIDQALLLVFRIARKVVVE